MANLSIREAVKHFDVSRPTLQKALKSGRISGIQGDKGHWSIDPSELARIYRPRHNVTEKVDNTTPAILPTENTTMASQVEELHRKLAEAEQRAAVAEALAQERANRIDDLRRMLPSPESSRKIRRWPWSR